MLQIRKKISHKLFASLFLVAVIPISIMGYGMYRAAEKTLIDSALMHVATIAWDRSSQLDTWYGERLNDIKVLSGLSTVREFCTAACSTGSLGMKAVETALLDNALALTRGKSPAYQSIHVLTPSGGILASTDPGSEMIVSNKYLEDLKSLKTADGPVLGPVHQHSNHEWYIHLIVPIRFEDGTTGAAILAILDALETLDPLLVNRAGLGSTGETYLVNEQGKIVTQSRYLSREETSQNRFVSTGISAALDHKEGVSIYRNYMGREVVGSYSWLPRFHAALLVEIAKDEVLAPLRAIRLAVFATAGIVSLISILAALLLSRQISRPIIEMADVSSKLSMGELDERISYSGRDEIGILSSSFNSMAEKLSALIDSLKQKEISLRKAYDDLLKTKEQLVQSEKMAAIGELVTSVVHEMRNPLSSVKLNCQIIGRTLAKESPLYEHHVIGLNQISQLEKMFSSLLDYSKPITIEKVPIRIKTIIEESLCQLAPHCAEDTVELRGIDETIPPVLGDSEKMRQVIVNIIKNAIEAAGPNGKVAISAKVNGKQITLEIQDNGPGISQQDLKRIFQPFFTTKQKGTGLGLSIVKKIMDAHGYDLAVSSSEGAGTLVSLHLQGAQ